MSRETPRIPLASPSLVSLRSRLAWLALPLAVTGCDAVRSSRAQLNFHLSQAQVALGGARQEPLVLRYAARAGYEGGAQAESWTYEIAVGPETFAERRTGMGGSYAFGLEGETPWLETSSRDPVVVDGPWAVEAHTRAAIFALRFAEPSRGDEMELMPPAPGEWDLSFLPEGGRSVDLAMNASTNLPMSYSTVDERDHIASCEQIAWRHVEGRAVPVSMQCSSIVGDAGRFETTLTLEEVTETLPVWARPRALLALPRLDRPSETPIPDPVRPHVAASTLERAETVSLLLDTGAPWTVLTPTAARALGVVATGEPAKYMKPPWLPEGGTWSGVVDRLLLGTAELHGVRVLVTESDSALDGDAGLLGIDVLRHFVVDIDSPHRVLRLHDPARFAPWGSTRLAIHGASVGRIFVEGEVTDVADGLMLLDTGAPVDIVVTAWQMRAKHPRKRGQDIELGVEPESGVSSEYLSHVAGFSVGPFEFPARDVYARDRDRHGNVETTGALALVGMGVMRHFRLAIDVAHAQIYAWPGPTYRAPPSTLAVE
jgi:predicted aspartyl protease